MPTVLGRLQDFIHGVPCRIERKSPSAIP
jgi:hypothetical protein